ncbi:TPA: hypothetical protein N0F65_010608, partial [Lagenidium giganteum]
GTVVDEDNQGAIALAKNIGNQSTRSARTSIPTLIHLFPQPGAQPQPGAPMTARTSITQLKYTQSLERPVVGAVKGIVKDQRVGLLIDGWTESGTHDVAIIAVTLPTQASTEASRHLLCFSTLQDEADMSASSIIELLDVMLDLFGISASQHCVVVCDHASVDRAIANKFDVPMIGCASDRLNLAVSRHYSYQTHIDKIHALKVQLNTITITSYASSVRSCRDIFIFATSDEALANVLPSAREDVEIQRLSEDLKKLESVNKAIQARTNTLAEVRALFDSVIQHFLATAEYLNVSAKVVVKPALETTTKSNSNYTNVTWVPATSDEVEHMFSTAVRVCAPLRRAMHPHTVETILMLRYNRTLWSPTVVAAAIAATKKRKSGSVIA